MYKFTLFAALLFTFFSSSAQGNRLWRDSAEPVQPLGARAIIPQQYRVLRLDASAMLERLAQAPHEAAVKAPQSDFILNLPRPDGTMQAFRISESPILAPGLARRFPGIKTYLGRGVDRPGTWVRLDYTPRGFHAMVLDGSDSYFIDPYYHLLNEGTYISYYRRNFHTDESFECLAESRDAGQHEQDQDAAQRLNALGIVGEELRTYRLAVAATGEYTQYHGGTVESAMAAIATTMNRVNGVYERDISCRMILIDSNHLVVFTDAATDPYSGSAGNHLGQNQTTLSQLIGNDNYDIGHVFHRAGGGGVAFLASVCSNQNKARGFTSTSNPVGDPFDIDYVAHEIGHQFGANHTQNNNCNRASNAAMEPGSASTIMGYAGICPPNLQNQSDAYFHAISQVEMIQHTTASGGNSCAQIIPTGNTAPVVFAGPNGEIIPISTPFELEGAADDLEGDSLTFCWEQFDLGPSAPPNAPVGNSPIFRSFDPVPNPVRVFPRLLDLVNGTTTIGEFLPNYTRNLNFRLTVRDNHGFGGGVSWNNRSLSVSDQAGPFRVLSQNSATTWKGGTYQTVQWDVANTDQAPINAAKVDIYLSADGGYTYPYLLASGEDNDGEALVLVPDTLQGEQFRVKVKASGRVFFNINSRNISIQPAEAPGLSLGTAQSTRTACGGQTATYNILLARVLGYGQRVDFTLNGLPGGVSGRVEGSPDSPAYTLNLSNTTGLPAGLYPFQLIVSGSGNVADTLELFLNLYQSPPSAVELLSPAPGESFVPIISAFEWQPDPFAQSYDLEVAYDAGFTDIFLSEDGIVGTSFQPEARLPEATELYWRVRGSNEGCGAGDFGEGTFSTEAIRCKIYTPNILPLPLDTAVSFVISRIEVEDDVIIRDVNIRNLQGLHSPMTNLSFRFGSPQGPVSSIIGSGCGNGAGFNLNLDDDAAAPIPCPFNNGNTYRPAEKLSIYNGQNAKGTWRLILFKSANNGSLQNWELEICFPETPTATKEQVAATPSLLLFPNPASERLFVPLPENTLAHSRLRVLSPAGQALLEASVNGGATQAELELASLPAGLYFLQWLSTDGQLLGNGRFVKR